jgi:histidinol-phosphatase (PHP family)
MTWTNYHNHCHYCDGKDSMEAHVQAAIDQGLDSFGMSCHAPLPFASSWSMKEAQLHSYYEEAQRLKAQYAEEIQLYVSLEADFVPEKAGIDLPPVRDYNFDFTLSSVHFVDAFADGRPWEIDGTQTLFLDGLQGIFNGDIHAAIGRYYALTRQMLTDTQPQILGHLDKIKIQNHDGKLWDESADWYRREVLQTLAVACDMGTIVEVNTRGMYKGITEEPYPGVWALRAIRDTEIPICLNSDAHHPREITGAYQEAMALLKSLGFRHVTVLMDGEWVKRELDE